jgi:hypothetical protein
MRVLQFAKRPVVTVAALCVALAACGGESSSDAPFSAAGTSADVEAVNATFGSSTFASFATFSLYFDAALGGAPIVSHSAAALDIRGTGTAGRRAAAVRSAKRLAAILPKRAGENFSASVAAIPPEVAGKTYTYDIGTDSYVESTLTGAPSNGVRFILYAVDPVNFTPVDPLVETGYVDLIDRTSGSTSAAQVIVVSGGNTYLDYTVSSFSTTSGGTVRVIGYVSDGVNQSDINLRSTITFSGGLTLVYSLDLPQRDVSIDLTMSASDLSEPTGTITINLTMRGPNGTVGLNGETTETGTTINVLVSGELFATITSSGTTTTITGAEGRQLSEDEVVALNHVFNISAGAFLAFDQMLAPIGAFFDEPA